MLFLLPQNWYNHYEMFIDFKLSVKKKIGKETYLIRGQFGPHIIMVKSAGGFVCR